MNKKLMAVAVAGALGAPGLVLAQAANVSIYGAFDGRVDNMRFGSTANGSSASSQTKNHLHFSAPRYGLRGTEDLGGGLSAIFQLEAGTNPDGRAATSDGVTTGLGGRDSWLGIRSAQWGTVKGGGFTSAYASMGGATWNAVPTFGHGNIIMGNGDSTGTAPNPNCTSSVAGPTGSIPTGLLSPGTAGSGAASQLAGQGGGGTAVGVPAVAQVSTAANGVVITGTGNTGPLTNFSTSNAAGITGVACTQGVEGNSTSFGRRVSNYIEYESPNFAGFVAKIGTDFSENSEPSSTTALTGIPGQNFGALAAYKPKLWSGSVVWSGGPWTAGMAYETHEGFRAANFATGANNIGPTRNAKDKGWQIGGKWNFGAGEVGVGYERLKYGNAGIPGLLTAGGQNEYQLNNWVINGNWKVTAAGTLSAGYSKTAGKKNCGAALLVVNTNVNGQTGDQCTGTGANVISLAYDHSLSKRTGLYAAYGKINNGQNGTNGANYYYVVGPLSNANNGTTGGVGPGVDVTTYAVGVKHSF